MKAKVGYSVPMFHVMNVERSIEFYELLGFEATNVMKNDKGKAFWAFLACYREEFNEQTAGESSSALMVTQADQPIDREKEGAVLYLYSRDLPGLRERVVAAGEKASEIEPRPYMEKGEMCLVDPDGYTVLVGWV